MSDSDCNDDWFDKDLESFEVELPANENSSDCTVPQLSKEELLELLRSGAECGGGNYKAPEKKTSKKKATKATLKDDEKFVQKLPITKLATIAGLSKTKSFVEAFVHEDELLETLSTKLTERVMELSVTVLENIFVSPFEEHKKAFAERLQAIDSFWTQFMKLHQKFQCTALKGFFNLTDEDMKTREKIRVKVDSKLLEVPPAQEVR